MTSCRYVADVRRMYQDLSNVQVLGALSYDEVHKRWMPFCKNSIRLGFFSPSGFDLSRWDTEFYRQAGLPTEARWKNFKLGFPLPSVEQKNFSLVHQDESRKFFIDPSKLPEGEKVFVTPRSSIWDWLPELLSARELHFIDSFFLNLADLLWYHGYLRDIKLVFHRYAKSYNGARWPMLKAPWRIV